MAEERGRSVALKWMEALKSRESALDHEEQLRRTCRPIIYRVHPKLREKKQEHFDHSSISIGLFDLFDNMKVANNSDIPIRMGDALKLNVVIKFLADIGETSDNWQRISREVVGETDKVKMLYDGHWDYDLLEENIRSALALDAIFLTSFLEYKFYRRPDLKRRTDELFSREDVRTLNSFLKDVFKVENQIPLRLIKNVLEIKSRCYRSFGDSSMGQYYSSSDDTLKEICWNSVEFWRLCLPSFQLAKDGIKFYECHHVLHYQAKAICISAGASAISKGVPLKMRTHDRNLQSRDLLLDKHVLPNTKLPRAKELHHYGLKFAGQDAFFPRLEQHRFAFWKATLFLPKIETIGGRTEVFWRNLLAFEDTYFGASTLARDSSLRQYLGFMDQLIEDEDDVLLMCAQPNPIIVRSYLADNYALANLFTSVMKGHFAPDHEQWASIKADIISFHNQPFRRKFEKFLKTYSNEPWLVVSLIAALILLVLTFLQTVYTMKSFYYI